MQGSDDKQSAPSPTELNITRPKVCLANRLRTVSIVGFNGETELTELALFLLRTSPRLKTMGVYTRRWWHPIDKANKAADLARRKHARGVALAKLASRVPPKVKFIAR